jgi:hypothetical protein
MSNAVAFNPCTICEKEMCSMCELQMHRSGLFQSNEWISVEERLPNESGKYICCTTKGTILIARFYRLIDGGCFSNHNICTVTHWMPLPEPPKMKGGAE